MITDQNSLNQKSPEENNSNQFIFNEMLKQRSRSQRNEKLWIGLVVIGVIILFAVIGSNSTSNETVGIIQHPKSAKNYTYKILSSLSQPILYADPANPDWKTENILSVLITTTDLSKSNLQKALTEIKDENLTENSWNVIDAYDSEDAFKLQNKWDELNRNIDFTPTEDNEFKRKYYVEIADHYLATLDNESGDYILN